MPDSFHAPECATATKAYLSLKKHTENEAPSRPRPGTSSPDEIQLRSIRPQTRAAALRESHATLVQIWGFDPPVPRPNALDGNIDYAADTQDPDLSDEDGMGRGRSRQRSLKRKRGSSCLGRVRRVRTSESCRRGRARFVSHQRQLDGDVAE